MGQFLIRKKITARGALLISQAKLPAGLERDPVFFLFFFKLWALMSIGWLSRPKLLPRHATRVTDSLIIMLVRGLCYAPILLTTSES